MKRGFEARLFALGIAACLAQPTSSEELAPAGALRGTSAQALWERDVVLPGGEDLGQRLGTILEARTRNGSLLLSAGFVNGGQSLGINDHRALSVFVRTSDQGRDLNVKPLALPSRPFTPTSLFVLSTHRGELFAHRIGVGAPLMRWDKESQRWVVHNEQPTEAARVVSAVQSVGDRMLVVYRDGIRYGTRELNVAQLGELGSASIETGLYANGRLLLSVFRGASPGAEEAVLYDCAWSPVSPALEDCRVVRFADRADRPTGDFVVYGMHALSDGQVLLYGLSGFIYIYRDGTLRPLVDINPGRSWQAYSTIERFDKLLVGHYPSGNLMVLTMREHLSEFARRTEWSDRERESTLMRPAIAGPSQILRDEAQSVMQIGDDLFVGMWPWGEVYKGRNGGHWTRVVDSLTGLQPARDRTHPYEREAGVNCLGMRVYQILPWQGGVVFQTTVKNETSQCAAAFRRFQPATFDRYGLVHYVDVPGFMSCALDWSMNSRRIRISLMSDNRIEVSQNGRLMCSRSADVGPVVDALRNRDVSIWAMPAIGTHGRRSQALSLPLR